MDKDRFQKIYSQGLITGVEILVDTQTGVNYLFCNSGNAGGLTPCWTGRESRSSRRWAATRSGPERPVPGGGERKLLDNRREIPYNSYLKYQKSVAEEEYPAAGGEERRRVVQVSPPGGRRWPRSSAPEPTQ